MVTGVTGQLGHDVVRAGERLARGAVFSPAGLRSAAGSRPVLCVPEDVSIAPLARADLDVGDPAQVRRTVLAERPDVIVHAAAYTDVDLAEGEGRLEAYRVNAFGARAFAEAAQEIGALLVYVSTDYVFDGRRGAPYTEWDSAAPLNEYGRSKWAGEQFVRGGCRSHHILRTSWLYGAHAPGGNFVEAILRTARRQMEERADGRAELSVVADQTGAPTWSRDLAELVWWLALSDCAGAPAAPGTYHASGAGSCTRCAFARAVLEEAGLLERVNIRAVAGGEYPRPARRPAQSVLEPLALRAQGLPVLRPWREALAEFMSAHAAGRESACGGMGYERIAPVRRDRNPVAAADVHGSQAAPAGGEQAGPGLRD